MAAYYRFTLELPKSDRKNDELTLCPWLEWAKIETSRIKPHFHHYAHVTKKPPGNDVTGFFHFAGRFKLDSFAAYTDAITQRKAWKL